MKIEVGGVQYEGFVAASVISRLDALSNTFSFQATSEEARPLPFLGGEACNVLVDGESVLTGSIELVNVDGDRESHKIDIQGRDKTGDLLDSSLGNVENGPLSDIKPPISLKRAIELVVSHLGTDLLVVDEARPALFNAAEDLVAPEPGQNAFEFIELLARKRQVLLTSNGDGDIVIASTPGAEVEAFLQHRIRDDANNVLSYSVSYDTTGRFNAYRSVSQLNVTPLNLTGSVETSAIVDQTSKVVRDRRIREGRQHVLVAESMYSSAEGERRALWERNIRRARGRVYSAAVDGYRNQTGNLWAINELVPVVDEYAGIEAIMLVNTVTFSKDEEGGSGTVLSLVERDAYSLTLAEPEEPEEPEEKMGDGLFG